MIRLALAIAWMVVPPVAALRLPLPLSPVLAVALVLIWAGLLVLVLAPPTGRSR